MPKNKINEINPVKKLFGLNLIRLRKKYGYSPFELARKSGLTYNFINDLENGKKGFSTESIIKLCNALDAEPFQLFMPVDFHKNEIQDKISKYIDKICVLEKGLDTLKDYSIFMENLKKIK